MTSPSSHSAIMRTVSSATMRLLGVVVVALPQLAMAQRDIFTAEMENLQNGTLAYEPDDPAADFFPPLDGQHDPTASDNLELTLLLLFFVLLLVLVVVCSLFSVCGPSIKPCRLLQRLESQSLDAQLMTRSHSYFREDLLNDDEILRLWICFYCDFANYELKTHCALCGNDKCEKEMPATPRSKAQSIRPASLFASMATTMSSSRSLSPSFLLGAATVGSPGSRSRAESSPLPLVPQSLGIQTLESSRSIVASQGSVESLSVSLPPAPRSPSGTPITMLQRRKEWQPVLCPTSGNVVWQHHSTTATTEDEPLDIPASPSASVASTLPVELVLETAFVTHNQITVEHPHGKLDFCSAQGAQVYGSRRPEYYNAGSDYLFLDPFAIDSLRSLSFPEKHRWFMQETTSILHVRWNNPTISHSSNNGTEHETVGVTTGTGTTTLVVPRDDLFHGTARAMIGVSQKQLHRPLRVRFLNEPGIDAGGIVREWFSLVLAEFLDDKNGLFQVVHTNSRPTGSSGLSEGSGLAYTIHPSASITVPNHLLYFRAFGRLLGKALLEGHLIPVPLADFLLKHILSVPVSFADLQALDGSLARSMLLLWDTPLLDVEEDEQDDDPYALDFTVYSTTLGVVELKLNGQSITVTEANKHEYIALYTRWHLGESVAEEIAALVSGVYDVMPLHLLAPFDYQELRLMLCGLPSVDVADWEQNTVVMGKKSSKAGRVVAWFWRIVRAMTMEQRCRLLQFATGAARVPVQGFKALTSSDGRLCPFTIYCIPKDECACIRAFTCFNRLDLPLCKSEKELETALHLLLEMDITGFSIQ